MTSPSSIVRSAWLGIGLLTSSFGLAGCGSVVSVDRPSADADIADGAADTSVGADVGADLGVVVTVDPTPAGCERVPTVPPYTGGAACGVAVANGCDCVLNDRLPSGETELWLAAITPKGEASIQYRRGGVWSCPMVVPGAWVQAELVGAGAGFLRDTKGAIFFFSYYRMDLPGIWTHPIPGAETNLPFEGARVDGTAFGKPSVWYARSSDGRIERRDLGDTGAWKEPVPIGSSTRRAFSFRSGRLVYAHDDGFVHRLVDGVDQKTTVPAGVVVADLLTNQPSGHTIMSLDAEGRWRTDWPTGCPGCSGGFPTWEKDVSIPPLRSSVMTWTRDGRLFSFSPNSPTAVPVEDARGLPPVLFARRLQMEELEVYARMSDCGVRILEKGVTTTVPRLVASTPPSIALVSY